MRKTHRDTASDLQVIAQQKHWLVSLQGSNAIRLTKEFGKQVISCLLLRTNEGKYDLQPITYGFKSRISYFDYSTEENRFARNQVFFISLFRLLKDANMWDMINNRETFLQVNESNTHIADKAMEIRARLRRLVLDARLVKTRQHKTSTPIEKLPRFRRQA